MSQRLESHLELFNVAVPLVCESRLEILGNLEDCLLSDHLWSVKNPLFVLEKRIVLCCDERIAQNELIRCVDLVVDGTYTRVVSKTCGICVFIQHQFLRFRRVQLYLPHSEEPRRRDLVFWYTDVFRFCDSKRSARC